MSALGISGEYASRDPETGPTRAQHQTETVVNQAKRRFNRCSDWETKSREWFIQDIKFSNADPYNMYA